MKGITSEEKIFEDTLYYLTNRARESTNQRPLIQESDKSLTNTVPGAIQKAIEICILECLDILRPEAMIFHNDWNLGPTEERRCI